MNKEDIRIRNVIVHIMDPTIGMPVLSDTELEYGSEIAEFLKEHIAKISSGTMPGSVVSTRRNRRFTGCSMPIRMRISWR